jgi:hypothetical protein
MDSVLHLIRGWRDRWVNPQGIGRCLASCGRTEQMLGMTRIGEIELRGYRTCYRNFQFSMVSPEL